MLDGDYIQLPATKVELSSCDVKMKALANSTGLFFTVDKFINTKYQ